MSDAYDYFMSHAVAAVHKARAMPSSHLNRKQRTVARVYHLLAKESAYAPTFITLTTFVSRKGPSAKSMAVIDIDRPKAMRDFKGYLGTVPALACCLID